MFTIIALYLWLCSGSSVRARDWLKFFNLAMNEFSLIYYKTPLELGIVPARRGSISTAMRSDRANALNVASIR